MTPSKSAGGARPAPPAAERSEEYSGVSVLVTPHPPPAVLGQWERLIASCPGSDVVQLPAWARLRGRHGFDALYVLALHGDQLLGGAQVLHRRVPVLGRLGYAQTAPVIGAADERYAAVRAALSAEMAALGRRKFRLLFIQPPEGAEDVSAELIACGFRASAAPLVGPGSVRVDLSADEQRLRANLSATVRRWTNKWHSAGVRARAGDSSDITGLVDLLTHTANDRGHDAYTHRYVDALYQELSPAGYARLFVGEVHGRPVAATLVSACGGTLSVRLKGMDRASSAAKLHVPAAVDWEIIRWAKAHGYRSYDLGGLTEDPLRGLVDGQPHERSAWSGMDRYKLQFGGTAYRNPPTVEMIRPWPLRRAYDLARRSSAGRALVARARDRLRRNRR